MRADRLLSALLLLQAHGRMTGRELAGRLDVSERTVHRDMESLSQAGVPVFATRGAQGGWQIEEDWRTQVPGLDEVELRALLMAQPSVIGDAQLAAAAERALRKLMASLPSGMRDRAVSIRQRLYVDTSAWRGSGEDLAMLPVVQDAVARDRKLQFHYRKPGHEPAERTVDPLGLVAKGSIWYLVAHTPKGYRTYRLSRMKAARLLDTPSERPVHFDLASFWKMSAEQLRAGWQRYPVILSVDPTAAEWLRTWRIVAPADAKPTAPDGWSRLRVAFDDPDEACFVVLGLGAKAQVIEPVSLRERVAAEIEKVIVREREAGRIFRLSRVRTAIGKGGSSKKANAFRPV